MNKKVLILAYYFPPMGLGGVQRMHKLAKYLPPAGYDVHVLTVKPVAYPAYDNALLEELPAEVMIHRSGSIDPTRLARILHLPVSQSSRMKSVAKNKGGMWPDTKIGWRNKAVKMGLKIIEEHNIDVILSSSPPITGHLVAMDLSEKTGLPWVADFRDIWESRPPEELYDEKDTIRKSYDLLNLIGKQAGMVTAINDTIGGKVSSSGISIPGGFDEEDFQEIEQYTEEQTYTYCYLGSVSPLHPMEPVFNAFEKALHENKAFDESARLHIIGANDIESLDQLSIKHGIQKHTKITGYLPHLEAIREASKSSSFILSVPGGYLDILTGKIFDYLALPKPILGIVPPDGEAARVIQRHEAGVVVSPDSTDAIAGAMIELFETKRDWKRRDLELVTRKYTAEQFAKIFDRLIDG